MIQHFPYIPFAPGFCSYAVHIQGSQTVPLCTEQLYSVILAAFVGNSAF